MKGGERVRGPGSDEDVGTRTRLDRPRARARAFARSRGRLVQPSPWCVLRVPPGEDQWGPAACFAGSAADKARAMRSTDAASRIDSLVTSRFERLGPGRTIGASRDPACRLVEWIECLGQPHRWAPGSPPEDLPLAVRGGSMPRGPPRSRGPTRRSAPRTASQPTRRRHTGHSGPSKRRIGRPFRARGGASGPPALSLRGQPAQVTEWVVTAG